ncbi:hypothetical protein BDP55DRAFT_635293 [Colletotrichum godetiae]|uniref:Uncharacterized protein n=1 Tax=Colletotrichum godetiae TaxID=1209918 RepID=A0AAJ0ADW3_9PEZI|nr:uncharacterized protein BDP55DRAFT_635293 [Colletotrichum godetiae]KAK1672087.1 hypothetical protein BDP55DRAFT_635293 [Colletotrichum godetiae]
MEETVAFDTRMHRRTKSSIHRNASSRAVTRHSPCTKYAEPWYSMLRIPVQHPCYSHEMRDGGWSLILPTDRCAAPPQRMSPERPRLASLPYKILRDHITNDQGRYLLSDGRKDTDLVIPVLPPACSWKTKTQYWLLETLHQANNPRILQVTGSSKCVNDVQSALSIGLSRTRSYHDSSLEPVQWWFHTQSTRCIAASLRQDNHTTTLALSVYAPLQPARGARTLLMDGTYLSPTSYKDDGQPMSHRILRRASKSGSACQLISICQYMGSPDSVTGLLHPHIEITFRNPSEQTSHRCELSAKYLFNVSVKVPHYRQQPSASRLLIRQSLIIH